MSDEINRVQALLVGREQIAEWLEEALGVNNNTYYYRLERVKGSHSLEDFAEVDENVALEIADFLIQKLAE